jgi:hypothetical protein
VWSEKTRKLGEQEVSKGASFQHAFGEMAVVGQRSLMPPVCDGWSCSMLVATKCRHHASSECRTASSFGRITMHPQDAASGKPLSRKFICAAWEKDARYWIGERSGCTAFWNVTTPSILAMPSLIQPRTTKENLVSSCREKTMHCHFSGQANEIETIVMTAKNLSSRSLLGRIKKKRVLENQRTLTSY